MGSKNNSPYTLPPKKEKTPQDPKVMDSALTIRENMRKQKNNRSLEE